MRKPLKTSKNTSIIPEFHFSPLEHALFEEMQQEAEIEGLLNLLFGDAEKKR